MNGHTPGVWWPDGSRPHVMSGGQPIADCSVCLLASERDANVCLMAASPDLLAACEAWIAYDTADDSRPNAGVQMMLDYDTALTLTRAAIARATGATS